MKKYTICETVYYEVEAENINEAKKKFLASPNPFEFLDSIEDRSIVPEEGDEEEDYLEGW